MFEVSPALLQTADRMVQGDTRLTLTPSVIPSSNYVIVVNDWNCLKYFCVFLYCNHQVHRDFWITLYIFWVMELICMLREIDNTRVIFLRVFTQAVHNRGTKFGTKELKF
jgi:hypothetical protein